MLNRNDQGESLAASLVEFKYPTLCVNSQLASVCLWLTDTTMTPVSEGPSDDTSSSLGDSAYEILGDSTILTSDDEDGDDTTDSASSVGVHGPDDVTSVAGTEQSEDSNVSGHPLDTPGITPARSEDASEAEDVNSSHVTITNPTAEEVVEEEEEEEDEVIRFEELPTAPESVAVVGVHVIRTFNEVETAHIVTEVLPHETIRSKTLRGTIRLRMSREVLVMKEPLRIWYAGSPEAKDPIIAKLATALAAPMWAGADVQTTALHRRPTRFSVVPVSTFGHGGAPEVELIDSMGLELAVDECTATQFTPHDPTGFMRLQLNGTTWFSSTSLRSPPHVGMYEYQADPPNHPLPHLVVIAMAVPHVPADVDRRQTQRVVREMANRHGLPLIFVAPTPMYTERHSPFTHGELRGPHACLEQPERPALGCGRGLNRSPLDLATFLRIDALQLNRNLAYLGEMVERYREMVPPDVVNDQAHEVEEKKKKKSSGRSTVGRAWGQLKRHGRPACLLLGVVLLCAMMGATSTLMMMYRSSGSNSPSISPDWARPSTIPPVKAPLARTTTTGTMGSSMASSARQTLNMMGKSLSTQPQTPNSLTVPYSSKTRGQLLGDDSTSATLNQSDQFKLQVMGDYHIVLRPPQKMSQMKRMPALSVTVRRQGQPIPVELSTLFEGVYAVTLRREDAWGVLNVTVATKSKPVIQEHLLADFGTPWLKMAEWQRAAKQMALRFQGGISQWPPSWISINNIPGIVRPPVRRTRTFTLSKFSPHHWTPTRVTWAAQQVSLAVRREQAILSAGLVSLDERIHDLVAQQREQVGQMVVETMQSWKDQARETRIRMSKTFTIPRARTQAGRIWTRVWRYRDGKLHRETTSIKEGGIEVGKGPLCGGRKSRSPCVHCRNRCSGWPT
ncbi:MAG: hypothetical protein M1823_001846 [Watsoniomyces obsoletus]|nr:MAG: hypothetical protein M1823_001846 [Watsoniomyces obsoletus]